MFSSVMSHLPKEGRREILLCGYQQTLYDATNSPKATTTFLSGLLQAGLLLATPFLSNTVTVAVAYSRGRWLLR